MSWVDRTLRKIIERVKNLLIDKDEDSNQVSSTSTVEKLTAAEVQNVIKRNGIKIDDFSKLLAPDKVLSLKEKMLVHKIREEIGLPSAGTVMNKTIPQSAIYKYLYDENYTSIKGFVSVDAHSDSLKGLESVVEGNRLDYNHTAFKTGYGVDGISRFVGSPDTVYGKITYVLENAESVKIPAYIPAYENSPYTGRGFTGSKNIILPELMQSPRFFMDGDILGIYDSRTGAVKQQFIYDDSLGWIMK